MTSPGREVAGPGGRAVSPRPGSGDRRTTRRRLLSAAVDLLREEGEAALSTTRLTQEVGIVQSGFYSHFPSVDACLAEAAALVVEEIRLPVRQWMEELRRQEPTEPALERTTAHFVRVLGILEPRWPFLDLLERYRRAPGPLGEALAGMHAELVSDVRDYLTAIWAQEGLAADAARPDLLAPLIVAMVVAAADVVSHDPDQSREAAAEALAAAINPMVVAAMEAERPKIPS